MKTIFATLLIVFCNLTLFAQSEVTKEEYAIYTSVFENIFEDRPRSLFVILDDTIKPDLEKLKGHLENNRILNYLYDEKPPIGLTPSTFEILSEDFKKKSNQSAKLEKQFPIKGKYEIVSKIEIDQLLEEGKKEYEKLPKGDILTFGQERAFMWQPFMRKFQNSTAYFNLSRVGYSADKKLALVYFNLEGGDYGSSMFYILEKAGDKWEVRKTFGSSFIDN